ncbi:alpha/beta fold hydrolase [Endozoicomonas elysicola]|uniref:alpha/beta fold hydrolase n=1 Tax=Endozoicomonas elysicola TaxID=305900 RepID=UPI0003A352C9|nr:alpha/beta hydrolase [Endozoicomonas elysicola]
MKKITVIKVSLCFCLWLMAGCASRSVIPEIDPGDLQQPLKVVVYDEVYWPVYTWSPQEAVSRTLRIYIEGDGRAWLRSNRPSMDPTPVNRLVHHLMLKDKSPDLAYIAQPCQYLMNDNCNREVWTFKRYSPKVLEAMNSAVAFLKDSGQYEKLELIGYSGGGTLALLIAAQRTDVISVRTVAGNLSPEFLNRHHGVSEIPAALDPLAFSSQLSSITQAHFFGARDSIVPRQVSHHYLKAFEDTSCINIERVDADHQSGWIEQWALLLERPLPCGL